MLSKLGSGSMCPIPVIIIITGEVTVKLESKIKYISTDLNKMMSTMYNQFFRISNQLVFGEQFA